MSGILISIVATAILAGIAATRRGGRQLESAHACAALTAFLNGIIELPQGQAAAMLRWSSTIE